MTVTFNAWPERPDLWNYAFQVTRMLGIIDFGGTDFTEIHEVIQRITPGDDESWYQEWHRMGELCEAQAVEAEKHANRFTARYAWQRASNYHRASQFYMTGGDARKLPTLRRLRDTFQAAIKHFDFPCEIVEVPYDGTTLPGYFVPSVVGAGRRPTILYLNGADSLSEEAYFTVALPASMAGYNSLVYNAPGVGLTLYEKNLPTRPDCERFVTPTFDWLITRPEVDPAKVCLVGESFAAYLIPRAAAFEQRCAAAVSWGALYSWGNAYRKPLPGAPPPLPHQIRLIGAKDAAEHVARGGQVLLVAQLPEEARRLLHALGGLGDVARLEAARAQLCRHAPEIAGGARAPEHAVVRDLALHEELQGPAVG